MCAAPSSRSTTRPFNLSSRPSTRRCGPPIKTSASAPSSSLALLKMSPSSGASLSPRPVLSAASCSGLCGNPVCRVRARQVSSLRIATPRPVGSITRPLHPGRLISRASGRRQARSYTLYEARRRVAPRRASRGRRRRTRPRAPRRRVFDGGRAASSLAPLSTRLACFLAKGQEMHRRAKGARDKTQTDPWASEDRPLFGPVAS